MAKKKILLFSLSIFTIVLFFVFGFSNSVKAAEANGICTCSWHISTGIVGNEENQNKCNAYSDKIGLGSCTASGAGCDCQAYTTTTAKECPLETEKANSFIKQNFLNEGYFYSNETCSWEANISYCFNESGCVYKEILSDEKCDGTSYLTENDAKTAQSKCKKNKETESQQNKKANEQLGTCTCTKDGETKTLSTFSYKCETKCKKDGYTSFSWSSGLPGPKEKETKKTSAGFFGPIIPTPTGTCPEGYACNAGLCSIDGKPSQIPCNYSVCDFIQVGINITRIILGMMGAIALILFIWGGQMLIVAGGNPEKIQAAKKLLINTIFGIIIILLAWSLVNFGIALLTGAKLTEGTAKIFGKAWNICK